MNESYGKELIIDLHNCAMRCTRDNMTLFFKQLCKKIDMEIEDRFFWDYKGDKKGYKKAPPHLKGTSAVQFIKTSNITVHALDDLKRVYLNIFSCKDFDAREALYFCRDWFEGVIVKWNVIERI